MDLTLETHDGPPPVTIIRVVGYIDASNYKDIINAAHQAYEAGARNFLLDLADLDYMSTSGIVSLQTIAKISRGETPNDGWQSIASLDRGQDGRKQRHVRLLNPQPSIQRSLEIVSLNKYFHIYHDETEALAAFAHD